MNRASTKNLILVQVPTYLHFSIFDGWNKFFTTVKCISCMLCMYLYITIGISISHRTTIRQSKLGNWNKYKWDAATNHLKVIARYFIRIYIGPMCCLNIACRFTSVQHFSLMALAESGYKLSDRTKRPAIEK